MTEVPKDVITLNDVYAWYKASKALALAKASEMLLRQRIAKAFFPTPKEGTNTIALPAEALGAKLQCVHSVNRKIDTALLISMDAEFRAAGFNPDELVERKPELKKAKYNELTAEQQHLFDQCLVISDGSPALKVVPAKPKE